MIRIGVIGAGGNGRGHARYYSRCERARLVAVAEWGRGVMHVAEAVVESASSGRVVEASGPGGSP